MINPVKSFLTHGPPSVCSRVVTLPIQITAACKANLLASFSLVRLEI